MCDSRGGTVTCKQCDQFSNVRSEMCPVMCGLCDRKYCRRTLEGPSVTLQQYFSSSSVVLQQIYSTPVGFQQTRVQYRIKSLVRPPLLLYQYSGRLEGSTLVDLQQTSSRPKCSTPIFSSGSYIKVHYTCVARTSLILQNWIHSKK